jgi:hypothetical protein
MDAAMNATVANMNPRTVAPAWGGVSFLLWLGLVFTPHVWAFATPKIPVQDDMTITVVADHMDFNGVQMASYEVHSRRSLDDVVNFYKSAWTGRVAVSEMQVGSGTGSWTVLSHRDGDYLITIQLQADEPSGCSGFAAVSDAFSGEQRRQADSFPMPAGSKVVNDITANDPGKRSRTLVLQNSDSVQSNLNFYRAQLQRQGWSEVGNADEAGLPQQWQGQQALLMNRDGDQLNLAVDRSADTSTIVIVTETR